VSEGVTISVAPTFATNFRAKIYSALQVRRLVSFVLATAVLAYYAVRGPDAHMRHIALTLAIALPLLRVFVIALSSVVTKANREYLTMTLTFHEDAIFVTRWGIPTSDDWTFVRRTYRRQGTLVLELQNGYDHVLVDRAKLSPDDWNRLESLLARRGKL